VENQKIKNESKSSSASRTCKGQALRVFEKISTLVPQVVFFQKTLTAPCASLGNGFLFSFFIVFFFLLLEMSHAETGETKKGYQIGSPLIDLILSLNVICSLPTKHIV
jgi:hypothetical protein